MTSTDSASPICLGDEIMALNAAQDQEGAPESLAVLDKAPDAWLVLHHVERRMHEATGFECAAFIAPTLQHLAESAGLPSSSLPTIYTLRSSAAALIEHGLGAMIFPPVEGDPEGLTFSVGDLVHLLLEGSFKASAHAHEWAPIQAFSDAPDNPVSRFFADPANPDQVAKIETAEPPAEVIPEPLEKFLRPYLKKNFPFLDMPLFARNPAGELALLFMARNAPDLQDSRGVIAKLAWLFPAHYHLLCVPKAIA